MLRASSNGQYELHLPAVVALSAVDTGIPLGSELIELADAVNAREPGRLAAAREQLSAVAPGADVSEKQTFVEAAIAVAANFQMMNRILDATGLPASERFAPIGQELGFLEADWSKSVAAQL